MLLFLEIGIRLAVVAIFRGKLNWYTCNIRRHGSHCYVCSDVPDSKGQLLSNVLMHVGKTSKTVVNNGSSHFFEISIPKCLAEWFLVHSRGFRISDS